MLEIIGYIAAVLMGIILGLFGGGGSILTVPILVYLFSINVINATSYSLFIVGTTAFFASVSHIRKGNVDLKAALYFGAPTIIGVLLSRKYFITNIPLEIIRIGDFILTKDIFLLVFFSILMFSSAISILKKKKVISAEDIKSKENKPFLIAIQGFMVGAITGLVGAGGGFLLVPALHLLYGLDIKKAIGTSLVLIAVNSMFGFGVDILNQVNIDYRFLFLVASLSIVGSIIGIGLNSKIQAQKLKPIFAWFVLIMSVFILIKELA